jgi:flagellar motor switch protein FliN
LNAIAEPEIPVDIGVDRFHAIDDVLLTVRVELDRRTITFRELLELGPGSVLAFPRPTGENVDIYAEEVLLGSGEILIVDTALAVRVADLRDKTNSETNSEGAASASGTAG